MQVYVRGSNEAVELYRRAFDASLVANYPNPDGTLCHAELDVHGQILAVSEADKNEVKAVTGNTMQFCLHFGEGKEDVIGKAFDALKDGAKIYQPPSPCPFSPLMAAFIDKFGVSWCIFV